MKELSYLEKLSLPHSLLLDPVGKRAAAYTGNHRLITPTASAALLACAEQPDCKIQKFDPVLHSKGLPQWRPLPDWATPEVQARMLLVYLRPNGIANHADWHAVPKE